MPKRFMPVSWFFLLSLYFSHSASALVIIDYNAVYYGDPDPSWAASGELHIMGLRIDASLTEVLALGINDQLQVTGSYVQANKIEFLSWPPLITKELMLLYLVGCWRGQLPDLRWNRPTPIWVSVLPTMQILTNTTRTWDGTIQV